MVAAAPCEGQSGIAQNTAKWGLEEMETQISHIRAEALMKPLFESRCNDPANNRIAHILALIGPAVLLPWPGRSKGDRKKWGHLQLTDMAEASYMATLKRAGNIGVVLGGVSQGLVTIDFDQDQYVDTFLGVNPMLANTLRTRGRRGCNIWLRCSTDYPRTHKLKYESGAEIGEWRADGSQTIISGIHPDGMPYQFLVEQPVVTISYDAITWPKSILPSCTPSAATESKRVRGVRGVRGVREDNVVCVSVCEQEMRLYFPADVISQIAPKDDHQNNASLFKLGRLFKSYEKAVGRPATPAELEDVFDRWCLLSRRFWRPGLTRDDYYAEFLEAYSYARMGLDENPIELAVCRAKASPLPQVPGFGDERVRLLAAICREIQGIMGANPFFLPTRKLGEILNAHYAQVARWLKALEILRVIHLAPGEVRRRGGIRSPRYHYGARTRNTLETTATNLAPPPALLTISDCSQPGFTGSQGYKKKGATF
jgi:hypothetical protein